MEVKSDPKLWATVTILVAIIGCVGILGAAFINVLPDILRPTPTIQANVNPYSTQIVLVTQVIPAISTNIILSPTPSFTSAPINTNIPSRPSSIRLNVGESANPSMGWVWICTGDFACTTATGNNCSYYDNLQSTGLILVIDADSQVTLSGPPNMPQGLLIGDCRPYTSSETNNIVSIKTSEQLSMGCGGNCSSVRIVEIGKNGAVMADYWKP